MKGIYALLIEVNKTFCTSIGALGEITFAKGLYAYVGSAQNNLELRVARHQRKEKRLFWHVDYLLNDPSAKVVDVYFKAGDKEEECEIASLIAKKAESIVGFGCSDCQCSSHLFHAESFDYLRSFMQPLK